MSQLEEKLGTILNDPNMMHQIMDMARMLSGEPKPQETGSKPAEPQKPAPAADTGLLQALSGIARQSGTDDNQQCLLSALQPYLSHDRICKLERAMSAARMARAASAFLNAGGIQLLTGR